MKTTDLIEQRASILSRAKTAHEADDATAFAAAETELRAIDAKLQRASMIDAAERREAGSPIAGDANLSRECREFSIIRAMAGAAGIAGVDWGRERELQGELAKRAGRPAQGILVPLEVMEQRVLTTAAPVGGPGSNLIQTDLDGAMFYDRLRAAMKVQGLGATVLGGLVGNLDIPGLKASATIGWVAENTALTASDHQFQKTSLTPKHVGALTELSRNMLQQPSLDIEQLVRSDFAAILAEAVDRAAINGSGTGAEPRGILNVSGIGAVALGTNGAALGIDDTATLIGAVHNADVAETSRGFLTTPKVRTAAMKLKDSQARPYGVPAVFQGERVEFSNNVPSNLTKGSGTNLSAIIYGNWADLLIGYWSAFDLLVNPYEATAYSKGNVQIRAMLTCDVATRYAASFAAIKDAVAA
jgi:HK97 family phage major capsid protein